ncbi:hypothetical protein BCR44DRAFT_265224 [Catenaria anguillulae PL171]|uniref:RING-type domain-containing protein n=1 Tax=Catenaria anguillulae PL171 TaxID=765915 RepID=A0A1Y2HC88_9FUNG|nr:hypothetical protein BCR44DRAFT_265224 [Catenaria anguillulae PL171]
MAHSQHHDERNASDSSSSGANLIRHHEPVCVCAICLDPLTGAQLVSLLPCRHTFCRPCIEQWALHLASAGSNTQSSASTRRQPNSLVAPACATCPLCKSRFTEGVALTPSNRSYGVTVPPVKWRLPVAVTSGAPASVSAPVSSSTMPVGDDSDQARLAASTNPLDDPIWRMFPVGYRSRLAECRRHLLYHAWWTSGRPSASASPSASAGADVERPVRRPPGRAVACQTPAAAVDAWIERDLRAVYNAILLGAPQMLASGQLKSVTSYDPLLVRVAKDLIMSFTQATEQARSRKDKQLDRLVQVLQLPSSQVAEKLVLEATRFAQSGLSLVAYDAMASQEAGVPTLVDMAKRDYDQRSEFGYVD